MKTPEEIVIKSCILYNKLLDLNIKAPDVVSDICGAKNKEIDIALKAERKETAKKVEWFEKWKLYTFAYPHTIKCSRCNKDTGIHFKKKTEILCRKCLIDKAFKGER